MRAFRQPWRVHTKSAHDNTRLGDAACSLEDTSGGAGERDVIALESRENRVFAAELDELEERSGDEGRAIGDGLEPGVETGRRGDGAGEAADDGLDRGVGLGHGGDEEMGGRAQRVTAAATVKNRRVGVRSTPQEQASLS